MNKTQLKFLLIISLFAFGISSCGDVEDPPDPNEEELITTVELTFTDTTSGSNPVTFRFADPDGEGGNAPTQFDTIMLNSNTVYNVAIKFLDESGTAVEDITEEVLEEADEHLVCYTSAGTLSVTATDMDGNGLAIGLAALCTTGAAEETTLTVNLRHQPGVKNGTCDVGETDVEVAFSVNVN